VDPVLIVGLGNPGTEYAETRHNVGFMVLDELSAKLKAPFKAGKGNYLAALSHTGRRRVVLLKPLTYMNNSGMAVSEALEHFDVRLEEMAIICDDFALPLGVLRIRQKGSDGGHNGLYSIIYQLNSIEFTRIRCGIRKETMLLKSPMAEFVLSRFDPEEIKPVQAMVGRAAQAALEFAEHGIARTMNKFNS
jgi:PTH1 family peptidyl-tRNA hydrolase